MEKEAGRAKINPLQIVQQKQQGFVLSKRPQQPSILLKKITLPAAGRETDSSIPGDTLLQATQDRVASLMFRTT